VVNICILDDDAEAAKYLYDTIGECLSGQGVKFSADVYFGGDAVLNALDSSGYCYNVYFLDILMRGMNGIQVAKEIRKRDGSATIIFLTSSPEYALEGYSVHAYNYLLKPLERDTLYEMLGKLLVREKPRGTKQLQITSNGVVKNVFYRDIVYIEVRRNKLLIVLNTGEKAETYSTITKVAELLKGEMMFTRTHRSFIVNMQYVREITSTTICVRPDYRIPVSRTYSAAVKQDYFAFARNSFV